MATLLLLSPEPEPEPEPELELELELELVLVELGAADVSAGTHADGAKMPSGLSSDAPSSPRARAATPAVVQADGHAAAGEKNGISSGGRGSSVDLTE